MYNSYIVYKICSDAFVIKLSDNGYKKNNQRIATVKKINYVFCYKQCLCVFHRLIAIEIWR